MLSFPANRLTVECEVFTFKLVFGLVNEHGETVSQAVFLDAGFAGHERIALVEERSTLRMAGVRDAVVEGRGVFDEFQVSI
ncbi:hypothetical protein FRC0547_02476 [Corynebacterium diphtheriae]|nr:hypothetical protein FRC0515_02482 [Corynebacterium diphtheriae]CAB1051102.1 hypothetical protein FRC0547_02476 [Corynebacterium diphtheriae]